MAVAAAAAHQASLPQLAVSVTALEEPPNFKRDLVDLGLFYSDMEANDGPVTGIAG